MGVYAETLTYVIGVQRAGGIVSFRHPFTAEQLRATESYPPGRLPAGQVTTAALLRGWEVLLDIKDNYLPSVAAMPHRLVTRVHVDRDREAVLLQIAGDARGGNLRRPFYGDYQSAHFGLSIVVDAVSGTVAVLTSDRKPHPTLVTEGDPFPVGEFIREPKTILPFIGSALISLEDWPKSQTKASIHS